jgi:amino acid transporter
MFQIATKSLAASDVMTTVLIVNFAASTVAALTAASRQLWSFARNRGLPFSHFFAPVRTLPRLLVLSNFFRTILLTIFLSMQFSPL